MLKKRIITASILAIVLIADTFLPMFEFAVSMALIVALAAWEWSNLANIEKTKNRFFYVLVTLVMLPCFFTLPPIMVLVAAVFFWVFALVAIIFYPASSKYWKHVFCRALMGLIVLPVMWLSFVLIHQQPYGAGLILILWAIVAIADIGAYFIGHAMGEKKLAPAVSPGKTREGAYGGLFIAAVISFAAGFFYGGSFEQALWCSVAAIVVAISSIVGDLFESMLKRFRGIKDSGRLLPGHGGVLDRIDGWTAAAPAYALFILHFNVMGV